MKLMAFVFSIAMMVAGAVFAFDTTDSLTVSWAPPADIQEPTDTYGGNVPTGYRLYVDNFAPGGQVAEVPFGTNSFVIGKLEPGYHEVRLSSYNEAGESAWRTIGIFIDDATGLQPPPAPSNFIVLDEVPQTTTPEMSTTGTSIIEREVAGSD
jgi:hypothetical protein